MAIDDPFPVGGPDAAVRAWLDRRRARLGRQVFITDDERQIIFFALALAALDRPDWHDQLGALADKLDGRIEFDALVEWHRPRFTPSTQH
jgi:hypothetical protein